jgi:chromosome segregation ATPase
MVMTLQEATKKMREAESLVAQTAGELRALESQEQAYAAKLAELGLTPEQVPAALEHLKGEEARLEADISALTVALAGALS